MKNKFLLLIPSILLLTSCSFFASGSNPSDDSNHEHAFSESFAYDDEYHWHPSTCGHEVTKDKEEHKWILSLPTFSSDHEDMYERRCSVCDYVQIIDTQGVRYDLNETEEYFIASEMSTNLHGDIVILPEFFGIPVKGIGSFSYCTDVNSISIPDSIEYVDENSFIGLNDSVFNRYDNGYYLGNDTNPYLLFVKGDKNSKTYTIHQDTRLICPHALSEDNLVEEVIFLGDDITFIGYGMLDCAIRLNTVTLPSNMPYIPFAMFHECLSLETITLPDSIAYIGEKAFAGCSSLNNLSLPASLTSIGLEAFAECSNLASLAIPQNVNEIDPSAFNDCIDLSEIIVSTNNQHFSSNSGVLFSKNGKTLIRVPEASPITSYTSSTITEIGNYAFYKCLQITSASFSDNLLNVGDYSFFSCENLAELSLGNSVKRYGNGAFYNCRALTTFTLSAMTTDIGDNCLNGCIHITSLIYNNTKSSFNRINLGYDWRKYVNINKIQCTDGDIAVVPN